MASPNSPTGRKPSRPALQNIPIRTELGEKIRKEFSKGFDEIDWEVFPKEGLPIGDLSLFAQAEPRITCPNYAIIEGRLVEVLLDTESTPDIEEYLRNLL